MWNRSKATVSGKETIRDRVEAATTLGIIGREREFACLSEMLRPDGPSITYVHGPYGIGKTTLILAFASTLTADNTRVVMLRGGALEPKEEAFLSALGSALDGNGGLDAASSDGNPIVIFIDDADELRLLASWIRKAWIPSLPAYFRVVLAGRSPPQVAWVAEFSSLFRECRVDPLPREAVVADARAKGFGPSTAERIWSVSGGHPLLFHLAQTAAQTGSLDDNSQSGELVQIILDASDDPNLKHLTEAAAVVRRVTRPLIAAMLDFDPTESLEAFAKLPFVQTDREGHFLAEFVRKPLELRLSSLDPVRHAAYRRAAASWIASRLKDAGPGERWRHMADLLHLVEQPQVRDAFFPPTGTSPSVEMADVADFPKILELVESVAGAAEQKALQHWIHFLPHRFHVVRGADGTIRAFYVYARGDDHLEELVPKDDLLAFWVADCGSNEALGEVLFLRSLMASDTRSDPAERAACLLDLKRAYFQSWHLNRVYAAVSAEAFYSPVYRKLGFQPLAAPNEKQFGTLMLQLPTSGLIGWVSELAGLGKTDATDWDFSFARDRREVTIGSNVLSLTKLEADVLAMLIDRAPAVVGREEMIETIWQRIHVGSNVVDTVIRSLRKKLGAAGGKIRTVPKRGYFLRPDQ